MVQTDEKMATGSYLGAGDPRGVAGTRLTRECTTRHNSTPVLLPRRAVRLGLPYLPILLVENPEAAAGFEILSFLKPIQC